MSALLRRLWGQASTEWAGSARLRWGVLAIGTIVWVYALQWTADFTDQQAEAVTTLNEEVSRTRPLGRDRSWASRADAARQAREALRGRLWNEGDLGLSEAALQDWLRTTTAKVGVNVRELSVTRAALSGTATPPPGTQRINARLTMDLNRTPVLMLLSEISRHERLIVVDRLALSTTSQPPTAELDLHVLATARGEAK